MPKPQNEPQPQPRRQECTHLMVFDNTYLWHSPLKISHRKKTEDSFVTPKLESPRVSEWDEPTGVFQQAPANMALQFTYTYRGLVLGISVWYVSAPLVWWSSEQFRLGAHIPHCPTFVVRKKICMIFDMSIFRYFEFHFGTSNSKCSIIIHIRNQQMILFCLLFYINYSGQNWR